MTTTSNSGAPDVGAADVQQRDVTADDIPAIVALYNRAYQFDGLARVVAEDEMAEEIGTELVPFDSVRAAWIGDTLAGIAFVIHLPSEVKEERAYVEGEVEPTLRNRGAGRVLMSWAIARASELLRSSGNDLPKFIRADSFDYIESAHRLYARMGMRQVRWMDELLRPLTDLPALPAADSIAGVRVAPWPDDRDAEILVAKNTAFMDHWGSTPASAATWEGHVRGYGARRDLSFIAVDDDDRVVAHCFCMRFPDDDEVLGRRDGWIDNLGTLREWRGKGVASLLIVHAVHAFAADGLTHASIGVDADNPTGAARLYRSLGFEPAQRSITSELLVS